MNLRTKTLLRLFAICIPIAIVAYVFHDRYQVQLGHEAIESTGLKRHAFEEALRLSKRTGKPVLAKLAAIWCPSCRRFDLNVLSDDAVRDKVQSEYIFARIEYGSSEGLAFRDRYDVNGFPTLLVIDSSGALLKRLSVSFAPETFIQEL